MCVVANSGWMMSSCFNWRDLVLLTLAQPHEPVEHLNTKGPLIMLLIPTVSFSSSKCLLRKGLFITIRYEPVSCLIMFMVHFILCKPYYTGCLYYSRPENILVRHFDQYISIWLLAIVLVVCLWMSNQTSTISWCRLKCKHIMSTSFQAPITPTTSYCCDFQHFLSPESVFSMVTGC